jgi:hypothetical protein
MPDHHPTAPSTAVKPAKPCPDHPLTAYPAGQGCKKINGKLHCFGCWNSARPGASLR